MVVRRVEEGACLLAWLERSCRDCTPSTKEMASIRFDLLCVGGRVGVSREARHGAHACISHAPGAIGPDDGGEVLEGAHHLWCVK